MAGMAHALTSTPHGNELRLARIHCQGMRELIESNPAHWEDEQALTVMRALCKRAWSVMHDPVCRACLAAIDEFAAALPWDSERSWSPGRMFGPWLARVLRAPQEEVERWIDTTEEAPLEAFLASLDLVAAGPFVREPRGLRVAAITPAAPGSAFDRAILPTLLGAALIAAACLFASLPLRNAAPLVAWLCIVALLLAWCVRATRNAGTHAARTVGQVAVLVTVCFLGASLVYRSDERMQVRSALPAPKAVAQPKLAAAASAAERPQRRAARPKVLQAALAPLSPISQAAAGSSVPAAFEDACASLTGAASLQCLRCANEAGVWRLLCQEKARLEYCQRREGTDSLCPSVIPASPPQ